MKKFKPTYIIFTFFACYLLSVLLNSEEPKQKNINIDKDLRCITVTGQIHLKKGILEFAAASNKTNRDYESFILLNTMPSELKKAFEEIDVKSNQKNKFKISIEYKNKEQIVKRNLTLFFQLNDTKAEYQGIKWVFTGGKQIEDGTLLEDANGEIIALQPNSPGLFTATPDYGNPYDEGEKKGFSINQTKLIEEFPQLKDKSSLAITIKFEIDS